MKRRSSYKQTLQRKGRRAAYQREIFYWELHRTTPRHGDRPFEIGHIDHTQLDVELVCSRTGRPLGRPWVTFLIDAYSRRLLAVYLTFDSPSTSLLLDGIKALRSKIWTLASNFGGRQRCRIPQYLL